MVCIKGVGGNDFICYCKGKILVFFYSLNVFDILRWYDLEQVYKLENSDSGIYQSFGLLELVIQVNIEIFCFFI